METYKIIDMLCNDNPDAYAVIKGSGIDGLLLVYGYESGCVLVIEVNGLSDTDCNQGIHGLHIHEGKKCTGTKDNPFSDAGGHFNMNECLHPYHSGDLPPLFSKDGIAWMAVYVNKFTVNDIIGRTIIIHEKKDDLISQPSGNAGKMIACGEIIDIYR